MFHWRCAVNIVLWTFVSGRMLGLFQQKHWQLVMGSHSHGWVGSCILINPLINDAACWWQGHQQAASSVHYTTSCKHSLVLLRMGETIAWNMLSWLKLLIGLLLHLFILLYHWCTVTQTSNSYFIFKYCTSSRKVYFPVSSDLTS